MFGGGGGVGVFGGGDFPPVPLPPPPPPQQSAHYIRSARYDVTVKDSPAHVIATIWQECNHLMNYS